MFDAEHFFDGYKKNREYALSCIKTAYDEGARWIILCDTNGGTLPSEIGEIVSSVSKIIPGKNLGIHAHNDTENAVANSLTAVLAGARQVQGTINGLGERCGNANLISLIPTIVLKKSFADSINSNDFMSLKSQVDEYAAALDSRITIILKSGEPIVDSNVAASKISSLDNHSDRPEIIEALANGYGSSKRFSSTVQK